MRDTRLASEIFTLMERHNASDAAGKRAMAIALVISMLHSDCDKEDAVELLSDVWDDYSPVFAAAIKVLEDTDDA
jgi:hypothetical protein